MSFFKAYDMRGTFGADFDLETVRRVGFALPQIVGGRRWLVGRDCRTTSAEVRDALVYGLRAAGAEVVDLGLSTTPMVYYFTACDDFDGSVMITASHNPPSDNGLKVSKRTALPVGYADGLDEVERFVAGKTLIPSVAEDRMQVLTMPDARARYLAWQRAHAPDFSCLKFAVDCSCGMASLFAHELFPSAIVLNDVPDGHFPCHSPNPLKAEAREQIAACVREKGLDCGLVFDGDADRCMFVDERGEFVQPDYLIPIVAQAMLSAKRSERPTVVHDIRTSRGAIEALRRMGCRPVMVPVGHAFAKPAIRRDDALCGGELAGHYYFGDFFGCDSGLLAATRILGEIAAAKAGGKTFSGMMAPIAEVYANSGEINFKVEDKDAAITRMLRAAEAFGVVTDRSDIDGTRLEFADGWINVRKSNTEPYLRLVAEFRDPSVLADRVRILSDAAAPV